MTVSINGTNGLTFNDNSVQNTAATGFGFKNRIINGAMVIDQRNAGASSTPAANTYMVDRWQYAATQASKFTLGQNLGSVTPPTGFKNYYGASVAATASVGATDYFLQLQPIEGYNVADLGWGAAGAATVTLSFWVRSSLTGAFGGALRNQAGDRSYPFAYNISAANTWEYKTITVPGETTGTWSSTNGTGINLYFGMGVGSTYSGTAGAWASANYLSATGATNVVGTLNATFYITGVQLEKGSTATSFDVRDYGTELFMCQRYYQVFGGSASGSPLLNAVATTGSQVPTASFLFPVQMRASPTATKNGTWTVGNCGQPYVGFVSNSGFSLRATSSAAGECAAYPDSTDDTLTFSAEL